MLLNGFLMSGDIEVAQIKNNEIFPICEERMPFLLRRGGSIEAWLSERAIDKHRTNSRLLKKVLRLTNADDIELVLSVHAAAITDNYWFKPNGSSLTYDDVNFKSNAFAALALYGDPDSFALPPSPTPELTNIGSFEKCWRLIDGKWWLYKQGNENELFSELFIYHLAQALGFNAAYCELDGQFIRSLDFTNGASVNYEPISSLVGDDEDYEKSFDLLNSLCPHAAADFVRMIYLDTICFNMDRHTKNYGVLRDINTGAVTALAPAFDHNIALISRGYPKDVSRENDLLIKLFCEFTEQNASAAKILKSITPPSSDMIKQCIAETGFDVDEDFIGNFILNGANKIKL